MNSEKILNKFHSILDNNAILESDSKSLIPQALATVFPASIEQIQDIVELSEENSISIIPTGNGTSLNPALLDQNRNWIVVSVSKMQKILYYEPDEMVLSVEAGTTLQNIQDTLSPFKQWIALDAPFYDRATAGGTVSSNRSLFLRSSYGSPRDLLIGVHAVMHEGKVIKGGGRVVKNVAGYDICKLFTNAHGTLGIITDTTFRVQVKPEVTTILCWDTPSLSQASELGRSLFQRLIEGNGFVVTNQLGKNPKLIVVVHGTQARVAWQKQAFGSLIPFGESNELSEDTIQALRDELVIKENYFTCRISLLPSEMINFLKLTEQYPALQITVDCALGIVWISSHSENTNHIRMLFASLSHEANIEIINSQDYNSFQDSHPKLSSTHEDGIQAQIKQQLDPLGTFIKWKSLI